MEKCKNKAEAIIPWAGRIVKVCKNHAHAMTVLGNVMGHPIEARSLPLNDENCELNDDLE